MSREIRLYSVVNRLVTVILVALALTSCSLLPRPKVERILPPILAQDEVLRPYATLGRIQVSSDRYFANMQEVNEWGKRTLREEAANMGADAVILPEISSRPAPHLIVPANEYNARGVAIRFK